ncbi:hypothetical protein [Pseudomonas fluorescens]|uniref:Uncharacterized protein n=1 Tax=Pseudomonas fluorescens TaxID=294 RepID=A0A7Z6MY48_PSEFL|nr:hypothetical protein [Pseudomonas fluorescens]RDS91178.1 hypothetical protein DL347_10700 [Pseudomonas fluorescens]
MSYEAPSLVGSNSSNAAEVSLKTSTQFEFSVPEPNDIPTNATVGLLVGSESESNELRKRFTPAGRYDADNDEVVKLADLRLYLSSDDLKNYVNSTTQVRYLVRAEWGSEESKPLTITVLP